MKLLLNAANGTMGQTHKLKVFKAVCCSMGLEDCNFLKDMLVDSNINILHLEDNDLEPSLLATVLSSLPRLSSLSIMDNQLDDSCCQLLSVNILQHPSVITNLDLSHNDINSRGLPHLVTALRTAGKRLKRLNLSWNTLGPQSLHQLAQLVR